MSIIPNRAGHRRPLRAIAALAGSLSLLTAVACAGGSPRAGTHVRVAAGFFPIAEAAEVVGGRRVAVENLTPPGGEPHDAELSPPQVDAILDADVLLYLGGGFQPAVEELAARREGPAVDLLAGVDAPIRGQEDEEVDPHVWLDPLRYAAMVERIGDALADADPAGAASHRANAAAHAQRVRALHQRYARVLDSCQRDLLVVSHAAFAYLVDRYDLRQAPITGVSPESEPDPQRLAELTDLVREEGVTTVFTETLVPPEVAQTLAREADVTTAVLNPLEGLTEEERASGETYLSVMERNLRAIADALGCEA